MESVETRPRNCVVNHDGELKKGILVNIIRYNSNHKYSIRNARFVVRLGIDGCKNDGFTGVYNVTVDIEHICFETPFDNREITDALNDGRRPTLFVSTEGEDEKSLEAYDCWLKAKESFSQSDYSDAVTYTQESIKLDEDYDNFDKNYLLALCWEYLNSEKRANEYYRKCANIAACELNSEV